MKNNTHILQEIIVRFWEDDTFKNNLINEPVSTIEKVFDVDVKVPHGKSIVVEDQTNKSIIYLNIPTEPSIDNMELSENDLELIAGGVNVNLNHLVNKLYQKEISSLINN